MGAFSRPQILENLLDYCKTSQCSFNDSLLQ